MEHFSNCGIHMEHFDGILYTYCRNAIENSLKILHFMMLVELRLQGT